MKKLSIVVPVYNEPGLPDAVPRLLALKDSLPGYELELVFVDDGSRDGTLASLLSLRKLHPAKIKVVQFTRNFGSMAAIQAGLSVSTGDCVGVVSADMQDPPELFLQMLPHWEKGVRAVFAVRKDREDKPMQRLLSRAYYVLMRRFAIADFPEGGFDCFLVDRQVVSELNSIREKNTDLRSLVFWLGHHHVLIPYVRQRREKGESKWTTARKIKLFIDSFVAFSYIPIRFASVLGLLFALTAFIYGSIVFAFWLTAGVKVEGWTALMIFIAFTAGVQTTMLGVLGEYLWRALDEARKRPAYVIEHIFEG